MLSFQSNKSIGDLFYSLLEYIKKVEEGMLVKNVPLKLIAQNNHIFLLYLFSRITKQLFSKPIVVERFFNDCVELCVDNIPDLFKNELDWLNTMLILENRKKNQTSGMLTHYNHCPICSEYWIVTSMDGECVTLLGKEKPLFVNEMNSMKIPLTCPKCVKKSDEKQ